MTRRSLRPKKAVVLVVGNEILAGQVADANTSSLARKLSRLGITVQGVLTVGDAVPDIIESLRYAFGQVELVFAAGGLGPTPDDNTKAAAAKVFHRRLVLDEELLERISARFAAQGKTMPPVATKQALVPRAATVFDNSVGLAPGLVLNDRSRYLVLLPGVPLELERVFEDGVAPYLVGTFRLRPVHTALVRTCGISESEVYERLSRYFRKRKDLAVSYLPFNTGVDIRLSVGANRTALAAVQREIAERLRPHVYATSETMLEAVVGEAFRRKHRTLAVAESCTGGLVADLITNVPGSSEYFLGGVVAYSNEVKRAVCGVAESTLKKFGAVSRETAAEMAVGVRRRYGSDLGLAVSGIAGPGGATADKPVGLVFLAVAAGREVTTDQLNFAGTRRMIKEQAAVAALDLLRRSVTRT